MLSLRRSIFPLTSSIKHGNSNCYHSLRAKGMVDRTQANSLTISIDGRNCHFSSKSSPNDAEITKLTLLLQKKDDENKALHAQIEELTKKQQKKGISGMIKEHGAPFFIWWTTVYGLNGIGIYLAIESGLVGGADAIDMLRSMGMGNLVDLDNIDPTHGNIAVSVLINECLELVRFPLVVATTPTVARTWHRIRGTDKNK